MSLDFLLKHFNSDALDYVSGNKEDKNMWGALDKNQHSSQKGKLNEKVSSSPHTIPDLYDTKALVRDLMGTGKKSVSQTVSEDELKKEYRKNLVEIALRNM